MLIQAPCKLLLVIGAGKHSWNTIICPVLIETPHKLELMTGQEHNAGRGHQNPCRQADRSAQWKGSEFDTAGQEAGLSTMVTSKATQAVRKQAADQEQPHWSVKRME